MERADGAQAEMVSAGGVPGAATRVPGCEWDGSAGDASTNRGWYTDSDQGREATDEDPTTFVLRVATLNVRGYQRKKTEVLATALRHKVDVLALTETSS